MRKPFWGLGILTGLWCLYWIVAATGLTFLTKQVLDEMRADGWVVEAGDIRTTGFPIAFRTRVKGLQMQDRLKIVQWDAPFVDMVVPAWGPTRARIELPPRFTHTEGGTTFVVTSTQATAHLHLAARSSLELRSVGFELEYFEVTGLDGWELSIPHAFGRVVPAGPDATYSFQLEGLEITPGVAMKAAFDPQGILKPSLELVRVSADITFENPLDRHAVQRHGINPRRIDIQTAQANAGRVQLSATGILGIDAKGIPAGDVTIKAVHWQDLVDLADAAGLIPPDMLRTVNGALGNMARADRDVTTLELPLSMANGAMHMGFFPLGRSPRF